MEVAPPASRPLPRLELAEIFRAHGAKLGSLPPVQQRAVDAILACRSAALGGHVDRCNACGHLEISYNSCRNRHCPRCLGSKQAKWVDERVLDLLPVPYYHVVFTIPDELKPLFLANRKVALAALFLASASTLLEVAERPSNLGAQLGFLSVLHTWTQKLDFHPHVHCIVAGGGVSKDQQRWVAARPNFFLTTRRLAVVFRAKLLESLERSVASGEIAFDAGEACCRLRRASRKSWVVHSKPPFGGPAQVLKYLARYTHKTAITSHRLVALEDDQVTFLWRDRANGNVQKTMRLDATTFLRRFLLHVLPKGFVRIRSYGFLANGIKSSRLERCRELLGVQPNPAQAALEPGSAPAELPAENAPRRCPCCGEGRLERLETFAPHTVPRAVARAP